LNFFIFFIVKGKDRSVGIALACCVEYVTQEGRLWIKSGTQATSKMSISLNNNNDRSENITKDLIRDRLLYIMKYRKEVSCAINIFDLIFSIS